MTIDPALPVWLIVLLLISLLTWSVVIEWRRPLRFRTLRLLACVISMAALGAIFLRPSYPGSVETPSILLTKAYSHAVADSLRRIFPKAEFYHLGEAGYRNSTELTSYRELFSASAHAKRSDARQNAIGPVAAIVGQGLPAYALDSVRGKFLYLPSPVPNGVTRVSPPKRSLMRNERATITGTYQSSNLPARLYFSGPGGKQDSLSLTTSTGTFSFSFTPRVSGRITCLLTLADSLGKRIEETLPLYVQAFEPLKILMLQDYPTFELQHLKNFLSDRGHQIVMRAQLSKNIFRVEFANHPARTINALTVPLLEAFDLLVVDPSVLSKLSTAERSSIAASLRNGLGMLVVFNGAPTSLPNKELLPVTFSGVASDSTSVVLHAKRFALPATRLKPTAFDGTTVTAETGRILSGYTPVREGVTGFQLLRETYSILLAGDSAAYGSLWTPLLNAVARPRASQGSIQLSNEFPACMNEPISLDIISPSTPRLFADSVRIPVGEDPLIDGLWHATVWTGTKGWHTLRTETDTTSYYVFDANDWNALRILQQQTHTQAASKRLATSANESTHVSPLSLTACWIIFLLSTGFLWLAPKL